MQRISPRAFWISFALWAVWWGVPYYFGGIFFAKLLTGTFGSVAVLYISQELAKREGLVIRSLEIAGKYCMEIYILSDIIKIPFRILLWSKLHMYYTAFAVCSVVATVLPVLLKKYFFDRFPLLNFLFFGEKRR